MAVLVPQPSLLEYLEHLGRKVFFSALFFVVFRTTYFRAANYSAAALRNTLLMRRANCHVHGTDQMNRS